MVPFDDRSPFVTSGIRLGTPALTTRGFDVDDMKVIAAIIDRVITDPENETVLEQARKDVVSLVEMHPLYEDFEL
jgi:glycine hydroxymethyltransferase